MANILRSTSVAATSVDENLVAGSAFEFARVRTVVSMGIVQSATGLFITIQSGGNVIAEEFEPPIETTAFPQVNEDFYFQFAMAPGDRLVVRARNSTGGALVARLVVAMASG